MDHSLLFKIFSEEWSFKIFSHKFRSLHIIIPLNLLRHSAKNIRTHKFLILHVSINISLPHHFILLAYHNILSLSSSIFVVRTFSRNITGYGKYKNDDEVNDFKKSNFYVSSLWFTICSRIHTAIILKLWLVFIIRNVHYRCCENIKIYVSYSKFD